MVQFLLLGEELTSILDLLGIASVVLYPWSSYQLSFVSFISLTDILLDCFMQLQQTLSLFNYILLLPVIKINMYEV